jgi:hypothetical protein
MLHFFSITGSEDPANINSLFTHSSSNCQNNLVQDNSSSAAECPAIPNTTADVPFNLCERDRGRWCIVNYNEAFFPGFITDYENDRLRVRVLQPIGRNKFIEPKQIDEIWYEKDEFVTFIEEPVRPSARSRFVHVKGWETFVNV